MSNLNKSIGLVYTIKKGDSKLNSDYHLDLWREVQKRWMVFGVLVSVLLATLGPQFGVSGGVLHTEYLAYVPLSYIYYNSGQRSSLHVSKIRENARLHALACIHIHVVAPTLVIVLVSSLDMGLDYRVVKGVILASIGGPCVWLSLAICTTESAASVVAANYLAAFIAEPLAMLVMCGRATVPPLDGVIPAFLTTLTPFAIGAIVKRPVGNCCATKVCACLLSYTTCCQLMIHSEAFLTTHYVVVTIITEFCWLAMSVGTCWMYVRCGVLSQEHFQTLAMCSIPKSVGYGWGWGCGAWGRLGRGPGGGGGGLEALPALFLAPAQALLLAAVAGNDQQLN